ncbi:MAG: hypothetical protein ACTHK8_03355 [Ginsengibacter sp.]
MKKHIFYFLIFSSIVLFSCKKEDPAKPDNSNYKLKTYSEKVVTGTDSISATWNFTYDAQDRMTSMFMVNNPAEKFTYSYPSDNEIVMDLLSSSGNIHEEVFFKNGMMDSTYQYNDTQDTTTEKYVYNVSKQLTKMYEYDYYGGQPTLTTTTNYSYDANGNLVKTEDTDTNVETYDYYPDLVNIMPVISPLLPSVKSQLMKTHTVTSNGYPVGTVIFTYTFDDQNRISTVTQTEDSSGTIATSTFTYY